MCGVEMKGQNIHWGGRVLGSYSLIFIPEGRRDFFPYLISVGSVMALVHDGNFLSAGLILL